LAIGSYTRSANKATFQVQAYNGSTANFKFIGDNFKLVDSEGKEYKVVSKRGRFSNTKLVERGQESEVGEVSFNVPKNVKLAYLHFQSEAGESIKYLP